jgi:hypothetical protein
MARRKRGRRSATGEKVSKLSARIKNLMVAGEPYHREMVQLHTVLSQQHLKDIGKRPEDLRWFVDAAQSTDQRSVQKRALAYPGGELPARSPIMPYMDDLGSRLVHAADVFSHIKAVEFAGRPNFVALTEGLMLGLLLTDLKGTTGADVKMPLPSFIIEIPPETVYTYDDHTGWHETKYIIVSEAISPHFGEALFLYVWSAPNENSIHVFDDHAEYFPLDISYEGESLANVINVYEELRKEEIAKHGSAFTRDVVGRIFGEEYYGPDFREKLIRIAINTIIYMTSDSAVVEHENQAGINRLRDIAERRPLKMKEQKQLEALEYDQHWILGTDIRISHKDIEEVERLEEEDRQRRRGGGRKLTRPSITRGHWRWQPYGPGRSLRKRKWIRPYIRGRELGGTIATHTYSLDENPFDLD